MRMWFVTLGLAWAVQLHGSPGCPRSPQLTRRPSRVAGVAARAPSTAVGDVATLQQLMDNAQVPLGRLDVRGDTSVLRTGTSVHPVLSALRARAASGSKPGARADGLRIGLAIEGGGMRGAVGAGMVAALHELGYTDAFDAVYGSSAGALVGAYFLSRQLPRFGPSVYYECLGNAGRTFINPVQLVRSVGLGVLRFKQWLQNPRGMGPPVLNLDYLLVDVMQRERPLDWEAFMRRDALQPLRVVASGLHSRGPRVLGSSDGCFASLSELSTCLRASMLLPGITGPPVELPTGPVREPLADAVLTEPVPYRSALAEGCTHVLVLRTVPDGKRVTKHLSLGEALIARRYFGRKFKYPEMLRHMLLSEHKRTYAEDILLLNEGALGGEVTVDAGQQVQGGRASKASGFVMPVALPEGSEEMGRLETRPLPILKAIQRGFVAAYNLLAPDPRTHAATGAGGGQGGAPAPGGADGASVVMRVFPDALVEPAI